MVNQLQFSMPRFMRTRFVVSTLFLSSFACLATYAENEQAVLDTVAERFQPADVVEEPDFQRHVSPLLGKLGCNGRSCHGSFQGRGDFRLSLFGYDFVADHEALLVKQDEPRVNLEEIDASLILTKPTNADLHEGGERYKLGSWEHHLLRRWIEAGGKFDKQGIQKLVRLEVSPSEIVFSKQDEQVQLQAVAVWPDGTREDVTPLCRFQANSEQIAAMSSTGLVTSKEPGDSHVVIFYDNAVVPVPVIRPVSQLAGANFPAVEKAGKIDELVVAKLQKLGVVPSGLSADAEFLRRVSLDLTGTLPSASDVEAFCADPSSDKRAAKIEALLQSPAYAAWWTTRLCDYTGNNSDQLNGNVIKNASQDWYDWIYKRVATNEPYDKIVEGILLGTSRQPDQSYYDYCESMSKLYHKDSGATFADFPSMPHYWNRRNVKTTEERAISFAYTFLGVRIQCAQCHKHPFDQWSKDDFAEFKGFFAGVNASQNGKVPKEGPDAKDYERILADLELKSGLKGNDLDKKLAEFLKQGKVVPFPEVTFTVPQKESPSKNGKKTNNNSKIPETARILGEQPVALAEYSDIRQPLMDWLRSSENPYFARAFVNRVWANYFNVGIVEPPDDLSLANPPSNKPLLDYLTQRFIESNFDMRALHREIVNSRTYQASWQPNETNAKDERNFSHAIPRRLPAEVAYDAFVAATAEDARAETMLTDLKDRSITLAGASARNQNGNQQFALQVFGRSIRESNCDCDRSNEASLLQTVFVQNDNTILSLINGGKGTWVDQLSREWSQAGTAPEQKLPKDIELTKEIRRTEVRLDKARKEKNEEQIKRLEDRLAELRTALKGGEPQKTKGTVLNDEERALIARQAFLRTLSRPPTDEELQRSVDFLASSATPVEGVRGLMWTLLNTKEFIVNH